MAQVRAEIMFERRYRAGNNEIQEEINRAGADEDFDGAECLGDDFLRYAGHLHQRDDAGERRGARHQDDLIAVRGQRLAQRDRPDDAAEQEQP